MVPVKMMLISLIDDTLCAFELICQWLIKERKIYFFFKKKKLNFEEKLNKFLHFPKFFSMTYPFQF